MSLKVNFLAQINPLEVTGGGEMINRELIEAGRRLGHEIRISAAYPEHEQDLFPDADLYFLSDIHNQPAVRERLPHDLVEEIVSNKPYIHLDNAYVDVCDLPYLPCHGATDGHTCPHKTRFSSRRRRRLKRRGCFASENGELYRNALLNIFLSPLHRKTISRIMGEDTIGAYFELRPTVDTALFKNQRRERDIENLFVGPLNEAKGLSNMRRHFPEGNIVVIGPENMRDDDRFWYRVGQIEYRDMPTFMNRAKNFIFLPRWPEPMGRVVIEAALCGCNLVTNAKVGATSFDFDISDPKNLRGAADEFWERVEETIGMRSVAG